jgi:hypothetical protein
MVIA